MQLIYEECGTTREQGKDTTTDYYLLFTSTYTVLLDRTRRHNFHTNKQRKTPSKTRGSDWTHRPLCPRSLVDRRNSQRPPQVTSTFVVTWLGDPRWTLSSPHRLTLHRLIVNAAFHSPFTVLSTQLPFPPRPLRSSVASPA